MTNHGRDSKVKPISAAVFGTDDRVVCVSRETIRNVAEAAATQPLKRARFCAHREASDPLHEMLIVLARDTYVRPHRHLNKSESFHVIEGTCDLILFDDAGEIQQVIELGAYETGRTFYYRLSDCIYHTVWVRSEHFIVHETTNGPFRERDAEFAPWAPDPQDADAAHNYVNVLAQRVEARRGKFAHHG